MSQHNLITALCHDKYDPLLITTVLTPVAVNTLWDFLQWERHREVAVVGGGYDAFFSPSGEIKRFTGSRNVFV